MIKYRLSIIIMSYYITIYNKQYEVTRNYKAWRKKEKVVDRTSARTYGSQSQDEDVNPNQNI